MYTNTGYLDIADADLEDDTIPLRINCCGVYRLLTRLSLTTIRATGRPDYQLLYIASGKAEFVLNGAAVRGEHGFIWSWRISAVYVSPGGQTGSLLGSFHGIRGGRPSFQNRLKPRRLPHSAHRMRLPLSGSLSLHDP